MPKSNPFSQLEAKLKGDGPIVVSGTFLKDLLAALRQDRIVIGKNLEESPMMSGRTIHALAGPGSYATPFKAYALKDESGQFKYGIKINNGIFTDVLYRKFTIDGFNEVKDTVEIIANNQGGWLCLEWDISLNPDTRYTSARLKLVPGSKDSYPDICVTKAEILTDGISRSAIAHVLVELKDGEHTFKITQLVTTHLHARWAVNPDPSASNNTPNYKICQFFDSSSGIQLNPPTP